MKILTVEYRRLRTFGSYQNETVGAVAEVAQVGETPSMALAALRQWVDEQLGDEIERANLREAINELEWRKRNLEGQIENAEKKWSALIAFLDKLGIERPSEIPDDLAELPF